MLKCTQIREGIQQPKTSFEYLEVHVFPIPLSMKGFISWWMLAISVLSATNPLLSYLLAAAWYLWSPQQAMHITARKAI